MKGSRLLEELARQQQIVLRLMSGLGEQLSSLIAVRDESRSLIDQLAASERQADSLIRQNEPDRRRCGPSEPGESTAEQARDLASIGQVASRLAGLEAEPRRSNRGRLDRPVSG